MIGSCLTRKGQKQSLKTRERFVADYSYNAAPLLGRSFFCDPGIYSWTACGNTVKNDGLTKRYEEAMRHLVFVFALLVALLTAAPPVKAQGGDIAFIEKRIELLQHDAGGAREQAGKARERAEKYRELEKSALRNAGGANQPRDREDWEKTAGERRTQAEKLEAEAAQLEAAVAAKDAEIATLRAEIGTKENAAARKQEKFEKDSNELAARDAAASAGPDRSGITVAGVIGLWRAVEDGDEPFAIVQQDPGSKAYPHRLEAHTVRRVWKGDFHTDPAPGDPQALFTYKPKAEEMNPEIPEWARRKIEGELEWQLEIEVAGTCGTPRLEALFYPGEVRWREDGEGQKDGVWIEGRGRARVTDLEISIPDMRFYTYGSSQLYLRPEGLRKDASAEEQGGDFEEHFDTVDALTEGQRFHIDVILPPELAEKQGETLKVNVKASGGGKTTVELRSGAMRKGRSVIYTNADPITIADPHDWNEEDRDPPFLSMNYILGYQGARIDLDVENAEMVEFSYGEALQTVPVYKSWVQRGIASHKEAVERLRPFYSMVVADGKTTAEQKKEATMRLGMIANYERIMESPAIHDYIRNKVGDHYFNPYRGILGMTAEQMQNEAELISPTEGGGSNAKLDDRSRNGNNHPNPAFKGVVWMTPFEKITTEAIVIKARSDYRDIALDELPRAITFALYATVAGLSGMGDLYTIRTGEDIFGKKVPGWQRIMSAISFVSGQVISFSAPHLMTPPTMKAFNPAQQSGRAMRAGIRAKLGEQKIIATNARMKEIIKTLDGMSAPQRNSIAPGVKDAPEVRVSDAPIPCGMKNQAADASPPPPHTITPVPPRPAPLKMPFRDVQGRYPQKTYEVNPGADPLFPPQEFETCQCGQATLAMQESTGTALSEMTNFGVGVKAGAIRPGEHMPLSKGYTDQQMVAVLEATGAETLVIPTGKNGRLTLEQIDMWMQRGWHVRDVVRTLGGDPHAINIRRMNRNASGEIESVEWFDSAYGKELGLESCDYINQFAADGYDLVLYRWKDGGGGGAKTAAAKPTIEYPAGHPNAPRTPGSAADPDGGKPASSGADDAKPAAKTEVEEFTIDTPPKVEEFTMDDPVPPMGTEEYSSYLDRAVARHFEETGQTPDPINVVGYDGYQRIMKGESWQPSMGGGASFSPAGVGTLRQGDVAIRVKSEYLGTKVDLKPEMHGAGRVPQYYQSGKVGVGDANTYIPRDYVEYFDVETSSWKSFPAVDKPKTQTQQLPRWQRNRNTGGQ